MIFRVYHDWNNGTCLQLLISYACICVRSVCMCVCMHVCMYVCVYACKSVRIYVRDAYLHACLHARTYVRTYARTHVSMYLCTYVSAFCSLCFLVSSSPSFCNQPLPLTQIWGREGASKGKLTLPCVERSIWRCSDDQPAKPKACTFFPDHLPCPPD